jgi:DNA topoisomerase-2
MSQPDTYVGNIEKHTQVLWVYENDSMVYQNVTFVLGLYKIFDKILVNVVDNKQ